MFTGIIRNKGSVQNIRKLATSYQLYVKSDSLNNVLIGDSIAIDGVCLTVTSIKGNVYSFDLSFETLKKTAFSKYKTGQIVNLEKALTLNSPLDGHIVQGHVDEIGKIKNIIKKDQAWEINIEVSIKSEPYLIPTGSISINGVSLTITNSNRNNFTLVIIPHSFKETNISILKKGDIVNIEYDFIAKYLFHFKKFPNFRG
jgi:riboflavin synthase